MSRPRLRDVARILPALGAVLFFVPVLWVGAGANTIETPPMRTSSVMIYLFVAWFGLIGLCWLSHVMSVKESSEQTKGGAD